jgi:hypothetical protein
MSKTWWRGPGAQWEAAEAQPHHVAANKIMVDPNTKSMVEFSLVLAMYCTGEKQYAVVAQVATDTSRPSSLIESAPNSPFFRVRRPSICPARVHTGIGLPTNTYTRNIDDIIIIIIIISTR